MKNVNPVENPQVTNILPSYNIDIPCYHKTNVVCVAHDYGVRRILQPLPILTVENVKCILWTTYEHSECAMQCDATVLVSVQSGKSKWQALIVRIEE